MQGNICVLGEASNGTSTQIPPAGGSVLNQSEGSENVTAQTIA
jgi:hypothetical protein